MTEYRNQNYPYRGQLMKTGAGDLLLYDETISLTGPTTVSAGRLILSNSVKMCASTIKLPNGNASLAVAEGAALKLSGLESPDGSSLDLNGATLDLGGTGEDAVFSGTLANGGTIRKTGPNSQTLSAPQTRNDWDVLGGTLHFGVPTPVVWYTFDDPDGLGRDSGTAGKQLSVSNAAGVAWSDGGVAGGCSSFNGTGCLKAETAAGLPGGNSPFTIALWIKPTNSSYALVTWGNEAGSQWNGFVSSGTTQLKHAFWEGTSGDFVSDAIDGSFTDGKWRHVAVTYDPATGTRKFYVDGALLSSKTVAGTRKVAVGKPFYLGIGKYSSNFKGKMDDVMVFDRTLTAADIATLANWRKGGARATLTPAGGNIRLESGATVSFAHADESFASIRGRGTLALHDAAATIAPAANATNEVGRLAGDGTLVKNGAGTFIGAKSGQTYTGGTVVNAGLVKSGVGVTPWGAAKALVTVADTGAAFDWNAMVSASATPYNFNVKGTGINGGGAIVFTPASVASANYNAFCLADLELSGDALLKDPCGNANVYCGFIKGVPHALTLNGYTLTIDAGAKFNFCRLQATDSGTIVFMTMQSGLASNRLASFWDGPIDLSGVTFDMGANCALNDDANNSADNIVLGTLIDRRTGAEASYGNKGMTILDRFQPMTTNLLQKAVLGNATHLSPILDLSSLDGPFVLPDATYTLTVAEGATVQVKLGGRAVKSSVPLITWATKPANFDSVKFAAYDRGGSVRVKDDGVYFTSGFMLIVR